MKVVVEKIQHSYLTVEVGENESPIEKARIGNVLGIEEGKPFYVVRKQTEKTRQDWPLLLRPMKLLAKPTDRGLGDIVERTIGPVGGDAYKLWYRTTFGKTCGCTKRKDNLNERYPL